MDRLRQADAILAAVASRSPAVLLPGRVTSPMDCGATVPVAREVIDDCWDRASVGPVVDDPVVDGALVDGVLASGPVVDAEMRRLAAGPPTRGVSPAEQPHHDTA